MELTRDRAGQPWKARHREIVNRIVRETEPPTDSLQRISKPGRTEFDDPSYERVGEVLELAGTIGAILMASGMPATATMDQVTAITAAYGIERCEVDVINTTIHVAAYRGPTLPAATTLHNVQSRGLDFSRLAAVDRLIGRIGAGEVSPSQSSRRARRHRHRARTRTNAGSPPLPGVRWRSRRREPLAPACWSAWSAL